MKIKSTRKRKLIILSAAASILLPALAGCSQPESAAGDNKAANEPAKAPTVSTEPVTLKLYAHVAEMDETMFKTYIGDIVKKKHPNITLEFSFGGVNNLPKLLSAGSVPDIIFSGSDNYMSLADQGVIGDMTDLIKKHSFDLSVFTPGSMETIKGLGEGKVTAIPFSRNGSGLIYNKDLFDKFGVPYPTNGMTYDQVIDLARKMTRTQDGVQYIGWEPGFPDANASPFSQPFVDTKTNKALIDTPAYKKVFEMMKAGYDIPGFIGPKDLFRYAPKAFTDDHTVSMYVDWYNKLSVQLIAAEANGSAPNWDIVTVPNFPEFANVGRHESVQFLLVSKQTPYKDQALQVIQAATSKEAQLLQSRNGRISILNDPDMLKEFGKDVKAFQGKHLENLFKFKPAPSAKATVYDDEMRAIVRSAIKEVAVNKKDVNTVLRQAQEAADKKLAEMMKK